MKICFIWFLNLMLIFSFGCVHFSHAASTSEKATASSAATSAIVVKKPLEKTITDYFDNDFREVCKNLTDPNTLAILMPASLKACDVSLDASKGLPLSEALNRICSQCGFYWDFDPNTNVIWIDVPGGRLDKTEVIQTNRPPEQIYFPTALEKFVTRDKNFAISVTAPVKIIDQVKNFLAIADKPQRKIRVSALVVDLTEEGGKRYGLKGAGSIDLQGAGVWNVVKGSRPAASWQENASANNTFSLRMEDGNAIVHATPEIVTLDGEKAEIKVGDMTYYLLTGDIANANYVFQQRFELVKAEIHLIITAYLMLTGDIRLSIDILVEIPGKDGTLPKLTSRQVINTVIVKDGETLHVGGLLTSIQKETKSKIPILGSIPGLGKLFFSDMEKVGKTFNLSIFITPTILPD